VRALSNEVGPGTRPLALAAAGLARRRPELTDVHAWIAEHLLTRRPAIADPDPLARTRDLLLQAWQFLAATAEAGGESIRRTPDLSDGVMLPSGAARPCQNEFALARARLRNAAA
jgi:hypothetical protein